MTIAGKNLGSILPDQSIFQVSQEELGLAENELELEDEQEDAKVQENPHKIIQDVLDKHANVFAVENWSTISSLPSVKINLTENAVPVLCSLIKQSEEDEEMIESEIKTNVGERCDFLGEKLHGFIHFFVSRSRNSRRKRKARTAGEFKRLNKFLKFNDYPLPVDEVSGDIFVFCGYQQSVSSN